MFPKKTIKNLINSVSSKSLFIFRLFVQCLMIMASFMDCDDDIKGMMIELRFNAISPYRVLAKPFKPPFFV
jgi:hypothetical protein